MGSTRGKWISIEESGIAVKEHIEAMEDGI